jgi:predicted amidohydrolase YtcJ
MLIHARTVRAANVARFGALSPLAAAQRHAALSWALAEESAVTGMSFFIVIVE